MNPTAPGIVALVATYKRPELLRRLLQSLEESTVPARVVVVDNGCDAETESVTRSSSLETYYIPNPDNLGVGGGLAKGEQFILEKLTFSHLLVMDDDTVVYPDALELLYEAMRKHCAEMAVPAILTEKEELWWSPGVKDRARFALLHRKTPYTAFVERFGLEAVPVTWCTGIAMMVSRKALLQCGLHRDIFWIRGEDLDFSLRVSQRFPSLFVPGARVKHLPPKSSMTSLPERQAEYLKHQAMLQNICYLIFRCPHGYPILKHLPGNYLRFFKIWGLRSLPKGLRTFWRGAILGRPFGADRKTSP